MTVSRLACDGSQLVCGMARLGETFKRFWCDDSTHAFHLKETPHIVLYSVCLSGYCQSVAGICFLQMEGACSGTGVALRWRGAGACVCGFVSCNDVIVYPAGFWSSLNISFTFCPGLVCMFMFAAAVRVLQCSTLRLECRSHDFIIVCAFWREPDPCSWHGTVAAPSSTFFWRAPVVYSQIHGV